LSSGESIGFDYLVVATGVQCDWKKVPGLMEALEKGPESGVCSNYRKFSSMYLKRQLSRLLFSPFFFCFVLTHTSRALSRA
jgi:sulfide:quinone oxidoreductase